MSKIQMTETEQKNEGEVNVSLRSKKEELEEQVLPEAGPVILDDEGYEEEEREREEAFNEEPSWGGEALLPFSIARESIFYQLRASMSAPPMGAAVTDSLSFLPDALRILFLCSHKAEELRHLRMQPVLLQEAVESWADENILPEQMTEASQEALKLYMSSHANQAESVPVKGAVAEEAVGN